MNKPIRILAIALSIFTAGICAFVIGRNTNYENEINSQTAYAIVIQQGSTGSTVKKIQQRLKNWGYYSGTVDGIYGPKTKEAVKYFQRKNGLAVDGIAGPKTLSAMGISASSTDTSSSSSTTSGYSNNDLNLLTRLIYSEARGESYTGQVAVGAVVMNRIKSSSFPNTMSGVIYQKNAFTAVSDGQFNLTPNATAKKAAQDAMNGWDPTYGALYYYNPKIATSSWIFTRKTTVTIGNHVFAV